MCTVHKKNKSTQFRGREMEVIKCDLRVKRVVRRIQLVHECHMVADLQGLDKGPEERADSFSFAEKFHQTQNSEQAEEGDGHFATFSFAPSLQQCLYVKNRRSTKTT